MRLCTPGRSKRIVVALTVVAVVVPVTQSTVDYLYHGKLQRGLTTTRWITVFVFFVVLPLLTLLFNVIVIHTVRQTRKASDTLGRRSLMSF